MSGCYSTSMYRGDGRIEAYRYTVSRYRIIFPEIDVSEPGDHTFTFSGAPNQAFMPVLLASPEQRDAVIDRETLVTATLLGQHDVVMDHRTGVLGDGWIAGAHEDTSPPGAELICRRGERAPEFNHALSVSGTYRLVVSVAGTGKNPGRRLSPALWSGGAFWPFE